MPVDCLRLACVQERYRPPLKKLIDTNILGPWVEVRIQGDGAAVTVGNKSSPPNHTAVIRSFQFGLSNGCGCNIEIFDEEGGQFSRFFNKITVGGRDAANKYLLKFRWGWQRKDCDGFSSGFNVNQTSCCPLNAEENLSSCVHTMVVQNISVKYSKGGFKFIIEGTDIVNNLAEMRSTLSVGSASNPVYLVPAVKKALQEYGMDAEFITIDDQCNPTPMRFAVTTPGISGAEAESVAKFGPPSIGKAYDMAGRPPIEGVINWVFKALPATPNKGIQVYFDSRRERPTLIFMEAKSIPDCQSVINALHWNLGTYLVNGGSCSPVIEFTPNIRWSAAMAYEATGAATGGSAGGPVRQSTGPLDCLRIAEYKDAGSSFVAPTDLDYVNKYFEKHQEEFLRRMKVHAHANLNWSPIQADLRIQGDPAYNDPVLMRGRFVSVVVMNPYHLGGNAGESPRWQFLAGEECNRVLSNRNWMVNGVFHDIREGSYTTTLKLILNAPGITIPIDAPLGGDPLAPRIR